MYETRNKTKIMFLVMSIFYELLWDIRIRVTEQTYFYLGGDDWLQQVSMHSTTQSGWGSKKKAIYQIQVSNTLANHVN